MSAYDCIYSLLVLMVPDKICPGEKLTEEAMTARASPSGLACGRCQYASNIVELRYLSACARRD
jgi:hypothetical protein